MNVLVWRMLMKILAALKCRHRAGLQIQHGRFCARFATACRAHYRTSSSSMLLTFNSSPTSR
jgi:hypothetical protein